MSETPLTVAVTFLLYVLWHALQLVRGVLTQPRHAPLPSRREPSDAEVREGARRIAEANVRDCMEKRNVLGGGTAHVLCAGQRNFREPWARDFAFACFGLLAMGERETVREGLEVFFRFQRPDGQLPVKVHSTHVLERYLHSLFARHQPILKPLRPRYLTGHRTVSLDGNGLLVVAACEYARSDRDFLARNEGVLRRALAWLDGFAEGRGLLRQGPFTDWADTVARTGTVLYTNVVYWRATQQVGELTGDEHLLARAERIRRALFETLWLEEEGYFATTPGSRLLGSDGNLLAVAWGLAKDGGRILDALDRAQMGGPVPTRCTDRPYPRRWIAAECYLARIPHYHTSVAWIWLGAWHVVACLRSGRRERALELLQSIDRHVLLDGIVYEVYAPDGHPLRTLLYGAEAPLTWNAAMLVYAHHQLGEVT